MFILCSSIPYYETTVWALGSLWLNGFTPPLRVDRLGDPIRAGTCKGAVGKQRLKTQE